MRKMGVVRIDTVAVLVRTREAGLGRWTRAWVQNSGLYRVMAVVSMALNRVVTVVSVAWSRGIGLVSMARRIVPGRGIVVGISCAIAQVGAVGAAIVDEVVEFGCEFVSDRQSGRDGGVCVTKVQIAASAGVKAQWSVTRRAFLGLEFLDELVETGLVGDMATRQLQNALPAQRVFQRLLACCAFGADQGALTSRFWASSIDHVAEFVVRGRRLGRG